MIMRFFLRLHYFSSLVFRVIDMDAAGKVYRLDPRTAWDLAEIRYPSPEQQAESDRIVREVIEQVRQPSFSERD